MQVWATTYSITLDAINQPGRDARRIEREIALEEFLVSFQENSPTNRAAKIHTWIEWMADDESVGPCINGAILGLHDGKDGQIPEGTNLNKHIEEIIENTTKGSDFVTWLKKPKIAVSSEI